MGDLHMKVKTSRLDELVGIPAWRQRQRDAAYAPAADHESQAFALAQQLHADADRAESFVQQPFKASPALFLERRERAAGKIALPVFAPLPGLKRNHDWNVAAGERKPEDKRRQPGEPSASALDHRDASRNALAGPIVHDLERRGQEIPGLAENAPIERRLVIRDMRPVHPRNRSSSPAFGT